MYNVYFVGSSPLCCKIFKSFLKAHIFAFVQSMKGRTILSISYEPIKIKQ